MQQWRPPVHRHVGPHKRVSTLYWMVTMPGCGKMYEVVGGYGRIEQNMNYRDQVLIVAPINFSKGLPNVDLMQRAISKLWRAQTQFEMQCNVRQCIEVCMYANHWASETMSSQ